jgi:cell division protein FtsW
MGSRTRKKVADRSFDSIMLFVTILLIIIGFVMIFSSSAIMAQERYDNMYFFAFRQLLWIVVGIVALVVGMNVDYKKWAGLSKFGMIAIFLLLAAVLVPSIGHAVGGARRWLRFGGFGFQPAELAKIVVIIYFASVLDRKYSKIETFYKDLLPPLLLVITVVALIYKQPDFGTSSLIIVSVAGMLFLGGVKLGHLSVGLVFFIPFIVYAMVSFSYRKARLLSFLNPFDNMYGSGFQLCHSIVALGDGGLKGVGLGSGCQKLFFIPEVHTDFVFSIIGQELGFIGTMSVVLLFILFTWRGIKIAITQNDYLGKMLAAGLTFLISFQAIINIGVVSGCLPTKGLSLPFLSFGGSSLLFNMFAVGVILNISKSDFMRHHKIMK